MKRRLHPISYSILAQVLVLTIAPGPVAAQTTEPPALEEIVVTAQKRDESLQKTPLAVTVVTGDQLSKAGITNISALGSAVPNVQMNPGTYMQITIRGIGINASPVTTDQAVSVNLDGIYMARSNALNGAFFDIDHVEALRGPQGTLYGRNSTAGAINITTAKPVFDYAGSAEVEFGNRDSLRFAGMLNAPLVDDKIAVRAAFQTNRIDGYMSSNVGKVGRPESTAARLHVLIQPTDRLKILLSDDYVKLGGDAGIFKAVGVGCKFCTTYDATGIGRKDKQNIARGEINWDLGVVALTYIGAHQYFRDDSYVPGGQNVLEQLHNNVWTHELRFSNSSKDDRLQWLLGVFSLDETGAYYSRITAGPLAIVFDQPERDVKSKAVFSQATYSVTDWLRATGGLRYNHDKKFQQAIDAAGLPFDSRGSWNSTSWRLALEADASPNSLVYTSVSTGFRAGGFFDGSPPNTFDPENITAYALGSKNTFAGGTVRLNTEAFYYVYKDLQVSGLDFINPFPAIGARTFNVGRSEVYGLEVDGSWRIGANDRIDAYGSYLHAKYADFVIPARSFPPPTGTPPTVYSGETMSRAPKISGRVTYNHIVPLAGGNTLTGSVTAYGATGQWLNFAHLPAARQKGFAKFDANLAFNFADRKVTVMAFARNITNRAVANAYFNVGGSTIQLDPSRTYGAMVSAKF